jgi:hypothetical protein
MLFSGLTLSCSHYLPKRCKKYFHLWTFSNGHTHVVWQRGKHTAHLHTALAQCLNHWTHRALHIDHQEICLRRNVLVSKAFQFAAQDGFRLTIHPAAFTHLLGIIQTCEGCDHAHDIHAVPGLM